MCSTACPERSYLVRHYSSVGVFYGCFPSVFVCHSYIRLYANMISNACHNHVPLSTIFIYLYICKVRRFNIIIIFYENFFKTPTKVTECDP